MNSPVLPDRARAVAARLAVLFAAAVLAVVALANLAALLLWQRLGAGTPCPPALFAGTSAIVLMVIGGATWAELRRLGTGGAGMARRLRAFPLDETDALHRRLRDVAEEAAVAAGVAVPALYALGDPSINALAVGDRPAIAAVLVTRGALERFDRAQLQGVVATQIAQIVNGDAALNLRLAAGLYGLSALHLAGRRLLGAGARTDEHGRRSVLALAATATGACACAIGAVGAIAARLLRVGISHQRVFLADSVAVQLTRDPDALVSALRRIDTDHSRPIRPISAARSTSRSEYLELISPLLMTAPSGSGRAFDVHPPIAQRIDRLRGRTPQRSRQRAAIAGWLARLWNRPSRPTRRPVPPVAMLPDGEDGGWPAARLPGAEPGRPAPTELLRWAETMAIAADDRPAAVPLSATPAAALITRFRTAIVSREDAARWLCALVAGASPMAIEAESDPRVAAALRWLLSAEGASLRVPVLELMVARLRRWSSAHRREMLERCRAALEQNGRVDSPEWIHYTLARHRLLAPAAGARGRVVAAGKLAHGRALAALFAMAAAIGESSLRTTRDTLAETATLLDVPPPAATPDELDTAELANALDMLVSLPTPDKPVLLRMLLRMARTPGDIDFDAFIRAVAAAIDCPLPRMPNPAAGVSFVSVPNLRPLPAAAGPRPRVA